jgi:NADH-quinone oxidoreductase subunit G
VAKDPVLDMRERGNKNEITLAPGRTLDNKYTLMTEHVCPVGALTSRDFRFKARVWFLKSQPSVCSGCATGCNMLVDYDPRSNVAHRLRPRDNAGVNQFWMCDDGMMSYKRFYEGRITTGLLRAGSEQNEVEIDEALAAAANTLRGVSADKLAIVLSAQHSNEDNLALVKLARELGASKLYLAALGGWDGDDILRHSDNNPNRAGAELVAGQALKGLKDLAQDAQSGAVEGALALGWASAESAAELAALARIKLVSLSSNTGALPSLAQVVVPVTVHAETFGTFVNAKRIPQQFKRAVFPPEGVRSAWETLAALSQQIGRDIRLGSLKEVRAALPADANAALTAANKPAQEAHV